jgi:SAM-dependent MidA family methyltransferase
MFPESPLGAILREEISAAGGRIPFARFMEVSLYHPEHGYYNTQRVKLGVRGDFYTSAHAGAVFAPLLARHLEQLWKELGKPRRMDWMELGAGDGALAAELFAWAEGHLPEFAGSLHYTAVEQSGVLRGRLREALARWEPQVQIGAAPPHLGAHVPGEASEASGITGCIFANEFFDALPFHILAWRDGRWQERFVCVESGKPAWCEEAPSDPWLAEAAESHAPFLEPRPDGWIVEIRPLADSWARRMGLMLRRGEALIIDYGYTTREWRQGRFPQGSAMAYHRHGALEDLLRNPGEQDLTAHVNFTRLMEAAQQSGFGRLEQCSQAKFLLELGKRDEFEEIFAECGSELERQRRAQLLKTLILPQGMGESFQVVQMRKGMGE